MNILSSLFILISLISCATSWLLHSSLTLPVLVPFSIRTASARFISPSKMSSDFGSSSSPIDLLKTQRENMVQHQIKGRGIHDERVLEAMRTVPRHAFVPDEIVPYAYEDSPQAIGFGQTISQPFMVAYMAEVAQMSQNDRVLEVGTGCGYAAAVFSHLAREVYTVETVKGLADQAKVRLVNLGYQNVHAVLSDGSMGLADHAPYDAIIVACSAPAIPKSLKDQLAINGRMIIPVKVSAYHERLIRVVKRDEGTFDEEFLMDVRFVPLIGKEGFK